MKIIRKDATITPTGSDDDFPGTFEVILSAPTLDRDGDILGSDEWKMPLPDKITFDSDHGMSVATTVGSGVPSLNDAGELVVAGTYSSLPRAQEVRTLVNEGHINTTSVAFMSLPKAHKDAKPQRELLNGAFVAIPSNREALVLSSKGMKAGARNSGSDAEKIQQIHDLALALGAAADGGVHDDKKDAGRVVTKSVEGSLEAVQDRASDALNDAYGIDAYVWLRATLPTSLIFVISIPDSSESETYQQDYTDDGSVVTLTGERKAVDLAEIVKPDPDEDAEPAETLDLAPAEKSAAATSTAKAAAVDSDAVTDEEIEAKALTIFAAQFI
jgi:hypothetical protein